MRASVNTQAESCESDMSAAGSLDSKIPTKSKLRGSLRTVAFLLFLSFAAILVSLTTWFARKTRYTGLEYRTPIFASQPQNAILAIQLFATVSLLVARDCFVTASESLRWSLARQGIHFLSFLVLSETTGFVGTVRIITSNGRKLLAPWRILAIFRFMTLYVALVIAQFIWLLSIDSQTAHVPVTCTYHVPYRVYHWTGI